MKRYLAAVEEKNSNASELLGKTASLLHKGVSKGIFHRNTAARTLSRLSKKLSPAS
jgi:small subunit ribosomal protein S20